MPAARSITSGSSSGQALCAVNGCHTWRRSRATSRAVRSVLTPTDPRAPADRSSPVGRPVDAPRRATQRPRLDAVTSLSELAQGQAGLSTEDVDWLHLLLGDWQLLADLSFADLVLWLPLH